MDLYNTIYCNCGGCPNCNKRQKKNFKFNPGKKAGFEKYNKEKKNQKNWKKLFDK